MDCVFGRDGGEKMKNAHARKIAARKKAERQAVFLEATNTTLDFLYKVFILALNREGMGQVRIQRVMDYADAVMAEYMEMQETDPEMADARLESAARDIMRFWEGRK
jgi:hypothetical protein